jgi:hypothetical protein
VSFCVKLLRVRDRFVKRGATKMRPHAALFFEGLNYLTTNGKNISVCSNLTVLLSVQLGVMI